MERQLPRLVVNFKTYPEASGKRALELAKAAIKVERVTGVAVAVAAQAADVAACAKAGARVYAQHVDRIESSQSTGSTRWETLMEHGAEGTLLNHSEHRISAADIRWCVERVRATGSVSLVCAKDHREAARLSKLAPVLLAIEPPELIGGDISVTTADPSIVRRTVDAVHKESPDLPVLCGAGVKTGRDVAAARRLGAYGVLVASGVTKAKDPQNAMENLASGLVDLQRGLRSTTPEPFHNRESP